LGAGDPDKPPAGDPDKPPAGAPDGRRAAPSSGRRRNRPQPHEQAQHVGLREALDDAVAGEVQDRDPGERDVVPVAGTPMNSPPWRPVIVKRIVHAAPSQSTSWDSSCGASKAAKTAW
jgi:hypothetical protein